MPDKKIGEAEDEKAKQIADKLWATYLESQGQGMEAAGNAWEAYQKGLSDANIIATLAGYRFKKWRGASVQNISTSTCQSRPS
jgi:hypothetical protein